MAKLNMAVSHRLSQDEALKRVKTLLGEVKTQFADQDQRSARGVERQHRQVQFLGDGILRQRNADRESVGSGTFWQSPFRGVVLQGEDRIHAEGASRNASRLTSRPAITRGPTFALAPFHL
ncbi:MAG: hypothetical protein UR25_C0001G0162 [Candidatus Nomurabacteria bacterium GW2011_GWE1_32_28]|uniref:Uncharacterized protein n=1 Tax=Candidatus Nomurabacteria bacterium GW2011_GWF1_31_48 TaxID=1618767 RepID=A0A0F9YVX0_9BACT|nr:MAG: hypothetical protein UR10_C0002G0117 [Candidatus Nomurabacteria bacterium GW2011_GWF2_30_133]KKP28994.1 MAG: hypothetical protein UR18_C0001G0115 [Candidatus Nomurabacteria bacterium GW2011_GWE2_31_40]KKP30596.1 MAG: hypothetical protein UR19_C0002G0117 [Candidatus Nomurabacteria bacterium GW2011_GWF1_31_48]KKP35249.1 MAG: hypothetical protein UR25_C0001G0162 [Candidatus Nomurabacteria bacterium GW2011_GWE1_32_28]